MSLNTVETAYANGQVIDASHINELTLALLGQFVGRDSNGVPTPNQSLGTLAIPWGNLYANGIILDGLAVDTSQITSLPNRIVSGKSRPLSSAPDFLRANGAALEFDILGASVDLILSINNVATSITADLNKAGIIAAPVLNNTALVNDTSINNDLYAGETDAEINEIIIDTVGSEIAARVGQIVAFKTPTGEILQGFLKTATLITNAFRGFYFDSSGNPIARGNLSNNDTITLMNIGWVFVEDNGTTVDVSYLTPTVSYTAPNSPQTGQYWFDISNQIWKRYSGASFEIINRILVGHIVSDGVNTVASRSNDFTKSFDEYNAISIDLKSVEQVESIDQSNKINVYGTEVIQDLTKFNWNITTDLESSFVESINTLYFVYLSDEGRRIISPTKPYYRSDLKGYYHPHDSYRAIGEVFNDGSSDFSLFSFSKYNSEMVDIIKWKRHFSGGGTPSSFNNLIIGETYRIYISRTIVGVSNSISAQIRANYNGTSIIAYANNAGASRYNTGTREVIFVASTTSVTFSVTGSGGINSEAILTHIPNSEETNNWG